MLSGHPATIAKVAFGPSRTRLASVSADSTVRVYNVSTGRTLAVLESHADEVFALAWHRDESRLATSGQDRVIRILDTQSWQEVAQLSRHTSYIYSLAFRPDGSMLASASVEHTVRLWDPKPVKDRVRAREAREAILVERGRSAQRRAPETDNPDSHRGSRQVQIAGVLSEPTTTSL